MADSRSHKHGCMHIIAPLISILLHLLLASMLPAGSSATAPSSGIRLELTHVDAKGGFTKHELMRRAMHRTRLRAAMLQAVHGTGDPPTTTPFVTYSHILSTTNVRQEEYLMQLAIGEEGARPFFAGADTGSNFIWIRDNFCPTPTAAAAASSNDDVPCCSNMCRHIRKHTTCPSDCGDSHGPCKYCITYGDGQYRAEGWMRKVELTLLSNTPHRPLVHIPGVAIGCSRVTPDSFSSHGLVGLGRGPESLMAQLGFGKFSYCLNTYSKVDQPSALLFGAVPDLATGCPSGGGGDVATTPLLQPASDPSKYYVHLKDISIGSVPLRIPDKDLEPHGADAGNMFLDTGCSYSNLAENVFNAIDNHMGKISFLTRTEHKEEVCYQVSPEKHTTVMPDMVLKFLHGANMILKWEQYTMEMPGNKAGEVCLAFNRWRKNVSVLGNFQQHNTHMLFDTIQGTVSFAPADCSKI